MYVTVPSLVQYECDYLFLTGGWVAGRRACRQQPPELEGADHGRQRQVEPSRLPDGNARQGSGLRRNR